MVCSQDSVDYATLFPYETIPKIHCEPTYESIKMLKDKLRANTTKINNDLGGGAHGHLGLILTPTEYATIPAIPYVHLGHPGALTIPAGTTNHVASILQEQHKKVTALFHKQFC